MHLGVAGTELGGGRRESGEEEVEVEAEQGQPDMAAAAAALWIGGGTSGAATP